VERYEVSYALIGPFRPFRAVGGLVAVSVEKTDAGMPPRGCLAGSGRCELSAITASQFSGAVILFIYVVFRVYEVAVIPGDPLGIQVSVASAATIIYIFLCFWLVEDKLIVFLRELRPRFAWYEFSFRVTLLIVIALMPEFIQNWIPEVIAHMSNHVTHPTDGADYVVVYLAVLYLMFLMWDALIFFGAPHDDEKKKKEVRNVAKSYYATDLIGFGILFTVEATRFFSTTIESILLIAFILFSARQVVTVWREMWKSHFSNGITRRILR
jgi:hypothetical protein